MLKDSNYSFFLFVSLAWVHQPLMFPKNDEYDTQFDRLYPHYEFYTVSSFNVNTVSEYEAMENYFKSLSK